jgi:hypothetical protein
MKSLLLGIGGALNSLKAALVGLGAFGVFGIALLDAGFVPLPGGLDVVVMTQPRDGAVLRAGGGARGDPGLPDSVLGRA